MVYLGDVVVNDVGTRPIEEAGRRQRMAQGNVQWVLKLFRPVMGRNPLAAIVCLRRIFRIFWAYYLLAIVLGVALALAAAGVPISVTIIVAGMGAGWISILGLSAAARESLKAPAMVLAAGHGFPKRLWEAAWR